MIQATEVKERKHLPIGTVVRVKGNSHEFMITSLFPVTEKSGEKGYFDFGASLLPLGAVTRNSIFFNKEDIEDIVFLGYVDIQFQELLSHYDEIIKQISFPKLTVDKFKETDNQNPFRR